VQTSCLGLARDGHGALGGLDALIRPRCGGRRMGTQTGHLKGARLWQGVSVGRGAQTPPANHYQSNTASTSMAGHRHFGRQFFRAPQAQINHR
jgi:hypothetical protein